MCKDLQTIEIIRFSGKPTEKVEKLSKTLWRVWRVKSPWSVRWVKSLRRVKTLWQVNLWRHIFFTKFTDQNISKKSTDFALWKGRTCRFIWHCIVCSLIKNKLISEIYMKLPANLPNHWPVTEAFSQRCSVKKGFLRISENSQGKTHVGVSFLIKLHNFLSKKRRWRE